MRRQLMLALVLGLGCNGPTDPYDELTVGLLVEPVVVRDGTPALILVTVFNSSRHSVELSGCGLMFEVRTVSGGLVGPQTTLCNLISPPVVRVGAENQYSFVHYWNGTGRGAAGSAIQLPAGEYRIVGTLSPGCDCGPRSAPATVFID
jgi:hypothetical protein